MKKEEVEDSVNKLTALFKNIENSQKSKLRIKINNLFGKIFKKKKHVKKISLKDFYI